MLYWKHKAQLLMIFLLLFGINPILGWAEPDWTKIDVQIQISPSPNYLQITSGEDYTILVKVLNEGLQVSAGDTASSSDPNLKYSGRLIVDVSLKTKRIGSLFQDSEFIDYENTLETEFESRNLIIPIVGSSRSLSLSQTINYDYDKNARIDEWLVFIIDVKVYIELYTEFVEGKQYIVGWVIDEALSTFYILDEAKESYVNDTLKNLKDEIHLFENLNKVEQKYDWNLKFDTTSITKIIDLIEDRIKEGDYFSAMEAYSEYNVKWKENLVDTLTSKLLSLESFGENEKLQQDYDTLKEAFDNLEKLSRAREEDKNNLKKTLDEINASLIKSNNEIKDLNIKISNLKFYNEIYLFVLLAGGGTLVIALFKTGMIEIVVEEGEENIKNDKNNYE